MSPENEQEIDPEAEVHVEEQPSGDPTSENPGEADSGLEGDPEESTEEGPDLEAEALAAAEVAISAGEDTIADLPDDLQPAGNSATQRGLSAREWLLRSMLVINLALMGVMLVLPGARTSATSTPSTQTTQIGPELPPAKPPLLTVAPPPGRERPGARGNRVTNNQIWSKAFMFLGEGRYQEAAESLLDYERGNPQMIAGQKLDLYTLLSTCLFKAGRMEEAEVYRARIMSLVNRGYLPEDLRNAARKAWSEGRSGEARRYYARFLLQQKQLSPALRQSVPEAYLRIGDSYRMAADVGAGEGRR